MNRRNHHSPQRHGQQRGFTLVELITVILILGVLAAVAIPRYTDLQSKARVAKVQAIAGSIKAAAGLVKATAMANGVSCSAATGTTVPMEGLTVALNNCYPQALSSFSAGILGVSNVPSDDGWVVDSTNGGGATSGSVLQINMTGAATPASCSISYTSAAANAVPAIAAVTSGC